METLFHKIVIKVFSKPEEDTTSVERAFFSLFPFDPKKDKLVFTKTNALGFNERKITIFEATLSKRSQIRRFTEDFFEKLNQDDKKIILEQLETRLDEELHFFIRLNKSDLLQGKRKVTDSGNCFHCRFAVQVFPHKRSIAISKLNDMLGDKE